MRRSLVVVSASGLIFAYFVLNASNKPDLVPSHDRKYQRVVALAPSYCETMVALGLVHKLVGVSEYCEAVEARNIAKVGNFAEANIEAIMALKPDLILAVPHSMALNALENLKKLGIAIFAHQPDTLGDIKHINAEVARSMGVLERGLALNRALDEALSFKHQEKKVRKALITVSLNPLVVAGAQTFASEIIHKLGLINMASGPAPWPLWSLERLLSDPPDLIIISEGEDYRTDYQALFQKIGLSVKLIVPEHRIFASPSPRLSSDILYLAKLLENNY